MLESPRLRKIMVVLLALLLALGVAGVAVASQVAATKTSAPSAEGVNEFYPGDTIFYTMTITNPEDNTATNTLTRIWDTLPNGDVIEFLGVGDTLVQVPGQTDTFYAQYVVDWDDAVWSDLLGWYIVTNTFEATGFDSAGDFVTVLVTRNSQVLEFAELGDFVWNDLNRDGIQDAGEPGIEGVTVNLWSADEECELIEQIDTTTTDENGYYLFDNLKAGKYYVQFILPDGDWVFTEVFAGDDETVDSNADPDTGISDCVTLAAGDSDLTIDAGMYELFEDLDVSKTAETFYIRTHEWDIDKWVETENGLTIGEEEYPKIWLYEDGSGDECATWYIDVDYVGYEDSELNVSGTVTIENTGDLDALIEVEDLLAGELIDVDFGAVVFPYLLEAGDTLDGTYSEDVESMVEGQNVVTVTSERDEYSAEADIIWGDPDEEYYDEVTVEDVMALNGVEGMPVLLGTLNAPNGDQFSYEDCFVWADYDDPDPASWRYDNTATIVETEQSASAVLKVNWVYEELTVEKTAETSYNRTHEWDIAKKVETEYGHVIWEEEYPKIWLYQDGSGDETATWTVDVTYLGYEDSDFEVCGEVTITNDGTSDAVITDIADMLGGSAIVVDFGPGFELPYTLAVGDTLTGTYCEEGYFEGYNEVTVTTMVDEYFADAEIVWGDPAEELYKVVNVEDVSDIFGTVWLGMLDADDYAVGEGETFTYDKFFAWTDYAAPGPYVYDNTATIIETMQSASARLVVNWEFEELCWADETAWAYGGDFANPNWDYVNNRFWGWTNGPLSEGSYEWDIYAGAGQNDLSKGTVVGTLYVDYDDGCVTVTYELDEGYYLGETHLWVGDDVLPMVKRGRTSVYTNAPGQFPYGADFGFDPDDPTTWETTTWTWSECGFEGDIYVAAHSVVWMQVECPNVLE